MGWIKGIVIVAVVLMALPLVAGQLGLLRGTPPSRLGVADGRLKPTALKDRNG